MTARKSANKQTEGIGGSNGGNVHPVRQLIRDRLIKECGPQQIEIRGFFPWKETENHPIMLNDLKKVRQLPLNILKVSQTFHSEVILDILAKKRFYNRQ